LEKARGLRKEQSEKKLIELFALKKIKTREHFTEKVKTNTVPKNDLNIDYDQVAMDLLSGVKEPNNEEQRRVLNSLKFISEEELKLRGHEMIVAFELLGLEQVVLALCEKMIAIQSDVKQKASTYYVWAQALNNLGDFYKTIDLIDDIIQEEPLLADERIAFLYLKAEACLKLKKTKMAKILFLEIKKQNPHYRLVEERLRILEAN
jgi:tetratricopeptide (TPR) repeat protein